MASEKESLLTPIMSAQERAELANRIYKEKYDELTPRVIEVIEKRWKGLHGKQEIHRLEITIPYINKAIGYKLRDNDVVGIVREHYVEQGYDVIADYQYGIITITTEKGNLCMVM